MQESLNNKEAIIFKEVKHFKDNLNRKADYNDYEYFKQRLHSECIFGREGKLADMLGL